ncbi:uncharacterized protein V1516DRAFT_688583 [Lipomyces oligophaga]|uniref:uncharacterized protein n=1 Tax=Lipomyces oligophaga TaxID=45792 RepID=UPI0034CD7579
MERQNLFNHLIQVIQLVFSSIVLGDVSYEIRQLKSNNKSVSHIYWVTIIFAALSIVTVIISAFTVKSPKFYTHAKYVWEFILAIIGIVSAAITAAMTNRWFCEWNQLNPFTKNECRRIKASVIFTIIVTGVWILDGVRILALRKFVK